MRKELLEKIHLKHHDIVLISDEVGYVYTDVIEEGIHLEAMEDKDKRYSIAETTGGFKIKWNKYDINITSPLSKISNVNYTLHRIFRYNKDKDVFEGIWSSIDNI